MIKNKLNEKTALIPLKSTGSISRLKENKKEFPLESLPQQVYNEITKKLYIKDLQNLAQTSKKIKRLTYGCEHYFSAEIKKVFKENNVDDYDATYNGLLIMKQSSPFFANNLTHWDRGCCSLEEVQQQYDELHNNDPYPLGDDEAYISFAHSCTKYSNFCLTGSAAISGLTAFSLSLSKAVDVGSFFLGFISNPACFVATSFLACSGFVYCQKKLSDRGIEKHKEYRQQLLQLTLKEIDIIGDMPSQIQLTDAHHKPQKALLSKNAAILFFQAHSAMQKSSTKTSENFDENPEEELLFPRGEG